MSEPVTVVTRLRGLELSAAGFTEQGPRAENQDKYSLDAFAEHGLVVLADGMGGERGGRAAAEHSVRAVLGAAPVRSLIESRAAVNRADRAVEDAVREAPGERAGMGCALSLLSLADAGDGRPGWIGAHVGDTRILSRSPDGTVRLETRDHTPAWMLWEAGRVALNAVPETEGANRLQRAVGHGGEPDTVWIPAAPGWCYALVSDGVSKAMRLEEIGRALGASTAAGACMAIREQVQTRGADDNFTAVVVAVAKKKRQPDEETLVNEPPAPTRSTPWALPTALALIALFLAGAALWSSGWGSEGDDDAARARIDALQAEIDSLRLEVSDLADPFGPEGSPAPGSDPSQPSMP